MILIKLCIWTVNNFFFQFFSCQFSQQQRSVQLLKKISTGVFSFPIIKQQRPWQRPPSRVHSVMVLVNGWPICLRTKLTRISQRIRWVNWLCWRNFSLVHRHPMVTVVNWKNFSKSWQSRHRTKKIKCLHRQVNWICCFRYSMDMDHHRII